MDLTGKPLNLSTDLVTVGANATGIPLTVPLSGKWDFIWTGGFYSCDIAAVMAGTDITFGGYLITALGASNSEEQFIGSKPVPINHLFGLPGIGTGVVPQSFLGRFPKTGTINVTVTSKVGASNLIITFTGFAWPAGQAIPTQYAR